MPSIRLFSAHFACLALCGLLLGACGDNSPSVPAAGPGSGGAPAQPEAGPAVAGTGMDGATQARAAEGMSKGRAFLIAQQAENGGFGDASIKVPPNVGFTALAAGGLLSTTARSAVAKDEALLKALRFIVGFQQPSGAIVDDPRFTNYQTSAAAGVLALAKLGEFGKASVEARNYLASSQIGGEASDLSHGGFPYKQDQGQAADLSNVQFAATTLHDLGLEQDSEVWTRLVTYLNRVQNYSEVNASSYELEVEGEKRTYVVGGDGGGIYGPGMSKAPDVKRADGRWEFKSYGSMTYALLKCLLFAGVDPKDPRVVLALKWIADHWSPDRNPGFEGAANAEEAGQQGYYYYVYTAARALAEVERFTKKPFVIVDAQGRTHDWRRELTDALLARQQADGSWSNPMDRWNEGSSILCTGYALQALAFASGRLPG